MRTATERGRLAAIEKRRESPEAYVEYQMLAAARGLWPRVLRQLPEPSGKKALEVGCGTGGLAIYLATQGMRVSAIDNEQYDAAALLTARNEARRRSLTMDIRHGDATSLPYGDESFDLVVCSQVFEHLATPGPAIGEIARVLHHDGVALIDFPGWYGPYNGHIDDTVRLPWAHLLGDAVVHRLAAPEDFGVYKTLSGLSYGRFERLARRAGLTTVERRPMYFLTHPGRALLRGALGDARRAFLSEPSELLRFGFLAATLPLSYVPGLREFFAAGYKYALRHQRGTL